MGKEFDTPPPCGEGNSSSGVPIVSKAWPDPLYSSSPLGRRYMYTSGTLWYMAGETGLVGLAMAGPTFAKLCISLDRVDGSRVWPVGI